ncbi:polysaccharide biosynthesis protein [Cyanobium sp. Aljojuca 7D2]|uniref:polysaccharide biosynthesis protein n=1 Tax=Cyanobium sp. Aljojuca 7D2 TaxID=2823698 RepID=UPI0020CFE7FA|nr:polysaccharide biosynthesis protein [Cyanobium sp. Aljojuca 7D2]MCP9890289.1 polysaccharide biosynthesis protein [Cyanobium sp. Aljojuca 7D2]
MIRHAVVTGAGLPVVRPFVFELLREQPKSLALCSDLTDLGKAHEVFQDFQQLQAPHTKLDFCSFSGSRECASLEAALSKRQGCLLFHGQTRRSQSLAQANPCDAVHRNLLLTRQVLQVVISTPTGPFVFLSSDLALQTHTVLGASLAAAEASVLEAAALLPGLPMTVVRFPRSLDPIQEEGLPIDRAWRQDSAAQAAVHAITANRQRVVLSWPDPLGSPQQTQSQPLAQAVHAPRQPLVDWLQAVSTPLQAYDNSVVSQTLLQLWRDPSA